MDRRTWLCGALAGSLATRFADMPAAEAAATGWFARQHVPIGLQLYTVGDDAKRDIDGTLARVAKIGYRTVELTGYHGQSPAKLRTAATRNHIKFPRIHVNPVS